MSTAINPQEVALEAPAQQGLDTRKTVRQRLKPKKYTRPTWMEKPSPFVQVLKFLALAFICVVMLYPLMYVIAMSFAAPSAVVSGQLFPTKFSLNAYQSILGGGIISQAMWASVFITGVGTVLSTFFTAFMAYGLTRIKVTPGAKTVLLLVLLTMMFSAGMIPNYLLIKQLGLLNSWWSLILPALISPFNLIVMRAFFMGLPGDIFEAARIDGASELRIFFSIVLPLSKAIIAVIALFNAVGFWNTFFNALIYINDTHKWPIQVVLNQYVTQNSDLATIQNPDLPPPPPETIQSAVIVLATVPILIVYPFLQKYFTKGVLTGAIKG